MHRKNINIPPTKLTKYEVQDPQSDLNDKSAGFIIHSKNKNVIKSFRLSELDLERLSRLVISLNKESRYKKYSEAETLRCMIHFCSSLPIHKLLRHFVNIE